MISCPSSLTYRCTYILSWMTACSGYQPISCINNHYIETNVWICDSTLVPAEIENLLHDKTLQENQRGKSSGLLFCPVGRRHRCDIDFSVTAVTTPRVGKRLTSKHPAGGSSVCQCYIVTARNPSNGRSGFTATKRRDLKTSLQLLPMLTRISWCSR